MPVQINLFSFFPLALYLIDRELHPRVVQRFMKRIIASVEDIQPHAIVSFKVDKTNVVVVVVVFLFECLVI